MVRHHGRVDDTVRVGRQQPIDIVGGGHSDRLTSDQLADIKARGTLICGVYGNEEPFGFEDLKTRELVGYEVDICRKVAEQMKLKVEFKVTPAPSKVAELVSDAVDKGAKVLTGGSPVDGAGYFYSPTVLADVTDDAELLREEIFGPVAPITAFESEPSERGLPASASARSGPTRSPRSRSVVGLAQILT